MVSLSTHINIELNIILRLLNGFNKLFTKLTIYNYNNINNKEEKIMKMLIEKNVLMEGLNAVSKALSTRNIIPVLNGIKFELKKDGLYLTATDNDITIQTFIDKKEIKDIGEIGCAIIYGKSLLDIIRKLPNTDIEIQNFENNEVSFKTETAMYNFNCFMNEDFPNIALDEVKDPVTLNAEKFKEFINKTSFACSLQESRPLLTGVNIKIVGDILECVATDSYRLSKTSYKLDKVYNENMNIVIPAKNINELVKIIDTDSELEIHVFSNKVLFKYENIIFQSSLLNGTYPNTDNLIVQDFKYVIKADLKSLYNTLDRASLLTQSKDKNIIDMELDNNILTIKASSLEMGKVEEKMMVENQTENQIKISYSAKYMLEALKMFNNENIYVLMNSEISPIILKEVDNEEFVQLILPMKTY